MNKTKLEYFKNQLKAQLAALEQEMQAADSQQKAHDEEVYADWTDVASIETDKSVQFKIRDRERDLMVKIQSALTRIDHGTFGECDSCGEMISEARLKATPITTLCIDCKSEMEDNANRYRAQTGESDSPELF